MSVHTIRTEDDAWEVLNQLLSGKISDKTAENMKLGEWASLDVAIRGDRYNASLTPRVMDALLQFHQQLGKSLALAAYGKADRRTLTEDDTEDLQLDFQIKQGSSQIFVSLADAIQKVGNRLETLPPETFLLVTIVLGLVYCGSLAIKGYFETSEARERTAQGAQENKRMTLLAKAYERLRGEGINPAEIEKHAASAYGRIVDSIPDADTAKIGGVSLSKPTLERLQHHDSEPYRGPARLSGSFTVRSVSNKYSEMHFLTLTQGNTRIRASYNPTALSAKVKALIYEALDSKGELKLTIKITNEYQPRRQLNGEIESFD